MIGRVIEGEYKIESVLGSGAYSVVYRCNDLRLCRPVAMKVLNRAITEDRDIRRFFAESRNLAALNHPNVIQIHRLGEFDQTPYIVMEYLIGVTLRERIRRGPIPLRAALEMMRQVASGLAAVHAQGILHRDLSTNNVMLTDSGQAKILDLGLSKDTRVPPSVYSENVLAGTVSYIAPELVRSEPATFASDVFSFGVILYEVLTGRNPFQAEHVTAVLYNTVSRTPEPIATLLPEAPARLGALVARCLEKNPAQRPAGMPEVEEELEQILTGVAGAPSAAGLGQEPASDRPARPRGPNPYLNRVMIKRSEDFFGRVQETHRIFARLNATPPGSISIVGDRKTGKSSLLNHVYSRGAREKLLSRPEQTVMVFLDFQQEKSMSLEAFVRILLGMASLELRGRVEVADCTPDLEGIKTLIQRLDQAGIHLVLLLDEFDAITTNTSFNLEFFSFLRYLANHFNVAYLTSSAKDLQELCHTKEISDSPFFNIFSTMRLGLFQPEEARELIRTPSARAGRPLEKHQEELIRMAGLFPFFLQVACSQTLEYLEENPGVQDPDFAEIGRRFYEEAKFHYRYIWDGLGSLERSTLLRLANGKDVPASIRHVRDQLARRSYIVGDSGKQRLFATTFAEFVREEAAEARHSKQEKLSIFDRLRRRAA